ncbi:MAG: aminoacyl-tRNA hydrolase [Candidatus Nomurabacteria bacterium]|jgi:PTH1 family peptidyl-tRNA hydrolase|nr:aminoacyl-tRNA hydrolase [Candidatus Nomurabacteria bacterium]
MKLIVFQGNPGRQYLRTRHNTGFLVADFLAARHSLIFKYSKKFAADTVEWNGALLAKPQTFYNETGLSVRKITDFYKIEPSKDLLVVCDDLNLPLGTLRTRAKGSDGGNNGLKSISVAVGNNYTRLRIGTENELRTKLGDTDFVLSKFSAEEWAQMPEILLKAEAVVQSFMGDQFETKKAPKPKDPACRQGWASSETGSFGPSTHLVGPAGPAGA